MQWSLPYVDSFGMGLMVTAAQPVYVGGILQGVVGYDVTMKYLLEPLEHLVSENTYAFVFTSDRGYTIYHPSLVNPSADIADISPVHYSVFEPHDGLGEEIEKITDGTVESINYSGNGWVLKSYFLLGRSNFKVDTMSTSVKLSYDRVSHLKRARILLILAQVNTKKKIFLKEPTKCPIFLSPL